MAPEVNALEAGSAVLKNFVRRVDAENQDLLAPFDPVEGLRVYRGRCRFEPVEPEVGEVRWIPVVEEEDFGVRRFLRTVQNPIERLGRGGLQLSGHGIRNSGFRKGSRTW